MSKLQKVKNFNFFLFSLPVVLLFLASCSAKRSSVAVVVDRQTYDAISEAVDNYVNAITTSDREGVLVVDIWNNPDSIKNKLKEMYDSEMLEGAVFVGEIPVPMIRDAQHLTTAFKMSQKSPWIESSVPSDRFYDDFNLKFNFVCRDTVDTNLFYYNLAGDGPQKIQCNIYTGRIKPTREGEEGYRQINDYLNKVVAERQNVNYLDKVASYAGHGSFSNSLSAWKDESVTLREQMPDCFKSADGARFYMFYMYPYMKETLIDEVQREDLDIMFFHEHGDTRRQYLTGTPDATYDDAFFELAKYNIRSYLRRMKDWGEDVEEAKSKMMEKKIVVLDLLCSC